MTTTTKLQTLGTLLLTTALLAVGPGVAPVAGQEMQTLSVSRALSGESRLDVLVRYGAGELSLRPASGRTLYSMDLAWDARAFEPVNEFDGRRLEIGTKGSDRGIDMDLDESGSLDVTLARDLPMDLRLDFGAGVADVDLGGLALRDLDVKTGASESRLDVSEPNPVTLRQAHFDIGAAEFTATNLGNLNAERLEVNAGVGDIRLDLRGSLENDLDATVDMGLGNLELIVPEDVGVRIDRSSFLTSFDADGFERRDGVYYSTNWDSAERKLDISIKAAFGAISVERAR